MCKIPVQISQLPDYHSAMATGGIPGCVKCDVSVFPLCFISARHPWKQMTDEWWVQENREDVVFAQYWLLNLCLWNSSGSPLYNQWKHTRSGRWIKRISKHFHTFVITVTVSLQFMKYLLFYKGKPAMFCRVQNIYRNPMSIPQVRFSEEQIHTHNDAHMCLSIEAPAPNSLFFPLLHQQKLQGKAHPSPGINHFKTCYLM